MFKSTEGTSINASILSQSEARSLYFVTTCKRVSYFKLLSRNVSKCNMFKSNQEIMENLEFSKFQM